VGSLVNSFVPAKAGDAVRIGLLLEALPRGRRKRIAGCFVTVQVARAMVLAALAAAAALPWTLPLSACALVVLRRRTRGLFGLSALAPVAKLSAAALDLCAVDVADPLRAAATVVPALELAALLPLTPGNVGVATTAVALALQARGIPTPEAVSAGIVLHAVETAAGICYGAASTLTMVGRGRRAFGAPRRVLAT
jgi:hypothetical protein